MNMMSRTFMWLNNNSKALGSILAILITLVGGCQYFQMRIEKRIAASLDILERREDSIFVEARTMLIHKWLGPSKISKHFSENDDYSSDLLDLIAEEIKKDDGYVEAMLNISTFYHNAASCAMDGICDSATLCGSLWAESQDYLDMHKHYFAYVQSVRLEDVKRFTLTIPEFVDHCEKELPVFVFSRHDQSFRCRTNLFLERLTDYHVSDACESSGDAYNGYDQEVEEISNSLRNHESGSTGNSL